ncbi:PREDICTED: putative F-box protein At1g19160 [Ipomoea nil]|uniref:putative F-box protein At1g19160 n=1 Tax=Ipomoea nil TaxID=35883 RepID=UPI000901B573|nr:PREDICTED: putative F-box protein At1g19160 [Ipomoea nil]XP_019199484.1 PREDICTED: putative F-box protein At1g19160 [Ipomoea nil]XP_019199485.1 PREDICTED: putative F-box protein At1g19160 [Ipomoea nil]
MEDCKLPIDAMIDILARLPVKTLMRFKCVCKFVYDLIKNNHQFMDKHYEFRKGKSHGVVIDLQPDNAPWPNKVFNLIYKESECDDAVCTYLDLPNSNTRYVKCCHGILCLILCRGDLIGSDIFNIISPEIIFDVLILNPFTREIKALPFIKVPDKPPNRQCVEIRFGFGLSNNMTWKIIMLLSFQDANWEIEDSDGIVMVCSQVGNLWSWRQIDAALYSPYLRSLMRTGDFYFKGKYYWPKADNDLIWFDLDDEVFGKIELPSDVKNLLHYTVMNESIAVFTGLRPCTVNEFCTEIWVMDENNNNNWHKHAIIPSSDDIFRNEHFDPIGFWNPRGHLLVFSGRMDLMYTNFYDNDIDDEEFYFKPGIGPNLISIDLETHEKKTIFTSQERKSTLNICLNQDGHVQVCSDRSVDSNILWNMGAYARTCNESLKLP